MGTPENARRLLNQGEAVLVFPEGVRGINKPITQAYQLQRFGLGFMRLALEAKVPIVPVAVVGAEEQYVSLANLEGLGRRLGMPALPVVPQLLVPALGLLPLPTRYHVEFGAPLTFTGLPDEEDAEVEAKVRQVTAALEGMLREGLARRRSIFPVSDDGPRTLTLPEDAHGRLDTTLSGLLPGVSRRRLKAAFHAGRVRLDGRRVRGADLARPGAEVVLLGLEDAAGAAPAPDLALSILHADDALIAVDKPAGVPAYPWPRTSPGASPGRSSPASRPRPGRGPAAAPGLCHRLDVPTSGVLLFARTAEAFAAVRDAFETRQVDKDYLALVAGRLEGEGTIEVPLGRARHKRRIIPAPEGTVGVRHAWPALTRWRALETVGEDTLVAIELVTGVTHQARAHLAWLGHPVVGDPLYGGPAAPRLMLHASRLALRHPVTGVRLVIEAPTPADFTRA